MNVIMLLKPKEIVSYLYETNTIRQGLETMHANGFTAIPVLGENGKFVGCVNEGDFLWHIVAHKEDSLAQDKYLVRDIVRKNLNPAVRISVPMDELLDRSMNQNFIPVVDDRDSFIGIVTRRDIIKYFLNKNSTEKTSNQSFE
ncbi:MAG: CBS domain-containing protein [Clostridiales bacterium]|nr:CBS domain-containing protein [Clostridiales bacterium]